LDLSVSRLIVCATAAAVLAACGGVHHLPASPPVDASVRQEIERENGKPWDAAHPLTWADFQAVAPTSGSEGALTGYSLLYGVECAGPTFRYEATAVFLPHRSWVRSVVLADSGERVRTLRHEQTHFNLTEVYARRLRRYLRDVYDPCGKGADALRQGADRMVADEADAQRRYDDETRHGLNAARQHGWEEDVSSWLAELADYRTAAGSRPAR
jgi:hypothetical protein